MDNLVKPPHDIDTMSPLKEAVPGDYVLFRVNGIVATLYMVGIVKSVSTKLVEIGLLRDSTNREFGETRGSIKVYKSGRRTQAGEDCDVRLIAADHPTVVQFLADRKHYYWRYRIDHALLNGFGLGFRYVNRTETERFTDGIDALNANELHSITQSIGDILTLIQRGNIRKYGKGRAADGPFARFIKDED